MCQTSFVTTPDASEEFGARIAEIFNSAGLAFMISIGHRTGLFDALAANDALTSSELAEVAGKRERYVREWLAAVTVGGLVEFDEESGRHSLPPAHAALLTRAAAPNNAAVTSQFFAALGAVESDIVACFEYGGGVPYERFPRFHEIMAEDSGQTVVSALHEHILPLVPELPAWLEAGVSVLDVGCGRAHALQSMAERYRKSRFAGLDLCEDAVRAAELRIREAGIGNLVVECADAARLRRENSYELVTAFDAIHDQARPDLVLRAIHRALKPGGVFLMQDIDASSEVHANQDHPFGPFLYAMSTMHCMTVSLAGDGLGLGTMWGRDRAERLLASAGFADVTIHELEHDPLNCFYVCRKAR